MLNSSAKHKMLMLGNRFGFGLKFFTLNYFYSSLSAIHLKQELNL